MGALCWSRQRQDLGDVGVVHHRQRLALVVKAGEYLVGVHPEFYNFEGYLPANGFALLGQVHGAHTAFTQRSNNLVAAEIAITGSCCRTNRLCSGFAPTKRTIESALDQTLRAQSRRVIGTQFRSALRAIWHFEGIAITSLFFFRSRHCNLRRAIPYTWQVAKMATLHTN